MDRRKFLSMSAATAAGLAASSPIIGALSSARAAEGLGALAKFGKAYGMVIDIQKCLDGKADGSVEACHRAHNVPDWRLENGEVDTQHEVKWIWRDGFEHVFPEQGHNAGPKSLKEANVLSLCNHCTNPPCVRVCPTQATWKRQSDGIVMMDMHRCIGCRFCMAACPYGSRSFNWKDPRKNEELMGRIDPNFPTRSKGVVEKCNFCAELIAKQLAEGKPPMPACVAAARDDALVFGELTDPNSKINRILDSTYTLRRRPSIGAEPNVYYIVGKGK